MTFTAVGLSCAARLTSERKRRGGLYQAAPDAETERFADLLHLG